ncbi:HlyD family secretion protein [Gilvibacter sp.]|uniref:HlyD family secretion protein n=1 Tax=Gilvibacter sp. TaxID=2729997 RepID=UPI003B529386
MPNNLENIDLRSDEVQEILSKVPNWMIRWGSVLFLSLIVMLLVMSWFIKYPDVIVSQAVITTSIPPQKEYARTTGAIEHLFIEDKQLVTAESPLAILENSANYQDVFYLKSILDTLKMNNRNFVFPIDEIPVLFLGDIDSDYALFENSYLQYLLNKELQPFSNENLANRSTASELRKRLVNLESQRELNEAELKLKEKDLERSKTLFDKGVISSLEYEGKQLEYMQAERNFKNLDASASQIREAIANTSRSITGTSINKTKEEMVLLKSVIQALNQLKKSLKDWELRYLLKSKINGQVSFLNVWSENQTVNQGDLVFTIVPEENSNYLAKINAPSQNSGKIKVGQDVYIKLENFPDQEFGAIKGSVEKISLIANEDGEFLIDVELPDKLITTYNKEIEFKQEMRGIAEIVTEDLRLIERFFYQFNELLSR